MNNRLATQGFANPCSFREQAMQRKGAADIACGGRYIKPPGTSGLLALDRMGT
jgi:hypothetical protein